MFKNLLAVLLLVPMLTSCMLYHRVAESITEPDNSGFVPNMPDVPMPRHFVADASSSSFFDSAEGRIAEINAEGFAGLREVREFYSDTLPKFGWQPAGETTYRKDKEILFITVTKGVNLTHIKYQLRPAA